jgi:hypothetical protein
MQNLHRSSVIRSHTSGRVDGFALRQSSKSARRFVWGWKVRLAYLEAIHHFIWVMAVLGAVFLGMLLQYNVIRAERQAANAAYTQVLLQVSVQQLTELRL